MDYEKAYKKSRNIAEIFAREGKVSYGFIETVFPELIETEEDRIIGEIIEFIEFSEDCGYMRHDFHQKKRPGVWIDWLEKQKESLHISESCKEKADSYKNDLGEAAYNFANQDCARFTPRFNGFIAGAKWQKEQKPTWGEEDERRYLSCLNRLETGDPSQPETVNSKWFKEHVHFRPSWKPSEEQMRALEVAFRKDGDDKYRSTINSLYNDLKKL